MPFYISSGLAQLNGTIIDNVSNEVIPFTNIWVENEDVGTSADVDGNFVLNKADSSKWIIFSAIGYESKRAKLNQELNTVRLNPQAIRLQEVVVKPDNKNYTTSVGKFKKRKINHYHGCRGKPWITARYFEYKEQYDRTRFISEIKINTNSDVKDAKFNVHFYSINEKGEPGSYLHEKNILAIAERGKKISTIDVSNLNIRFPEEGLFIALEWLIIDENEHEYSYTISDNKEKLTGIRYEPSFGTVETNVNNGYIYRKGEWISSSSFYDSEIFKGKSYMLAVELTLSN